MASIQQLMKRGSMVPDGAGGWKLELSTKFKWDLPHVKKKLGEADAKALKYAGMDVRKAVQKGMSNRQPLSKPRQWKIAERHGFQLVALVRKVPKPDVVTSWRTSKNPKGELRQSIQSDYDIKAGKVRIGPEYPPMRPSVNRLLEEGGTTTHYFVPVARNPPGRRRNVVYGRLQNSRPRVRGTRIEQTGVFSFQRTVKGRGFMAKGLAKALPKIPDRYRNTITGP